jgi:hypothetical protein
MNAYGFYKPVSGEIPLTMSGIQDIRIFFVLHLLKPLFDVRIILPFKEISRLVLIYAKS